MSVNNKRVFYVKYLAHQIYADILRTRPDVRLDRLENESAEEIYAPILRDAHAYQIGAARDELAPHFHVDAKLLQRAPNLLIVSSNGAGFDPVDVEACTDAGVLVVNQSGGNAHSVAGGAGQDYRHRRHRQCRPPYRRALQGPARHEGAGL